MNKQKGFTIIELLVVISIIALLVSILMPALSRARELARRVVCASNLKQSSLLLFMYSDDHRDYYPPHDGPPTYHGWGQKHPFCAWWLGKYADIDWESSFYTSYLGNPEVLFCPGNNNYQTRLEYFETGQTGVIGYQYYCNFKGNFNNSHWIDLEEKDRMPNRNSDKMDFPMMSDWASEWTSDGWFWSHTEKKHEGGNMLRHGGDVQWRNLDDARPGPDYKYAGGSAKYYWYSD